MVEYLVIVESPAKAKTIGKYLGKNYKIEASMGHIRDLPKSQIGIDIENNFQPKYISIRGKGDLINKLKKSAKASKKVLLATDPDREGEAISWHLANILKIDEKDKCRITFNEITKNAIKNAVASPREIDMNLVDAQQARRVLDRIVGYKISPLLWKKVRKGLSAGRVQSVTTRLICEREEEIIEFIPEEYWSITAILSQLKVHISFEAKFFGVGNEKIELTNEKQVKDILKEIENKKFVIDKIKKGEKKRSPAPPFITSTLQQEASRKLGYTTKKTMMLAQQLYEGVELKGHDAVGLVSYIRTDSTRISKEAQENARVFIESKFGSSYLPKEIRTFKNKSTSQDAHEAIRPTDMGFTPDEVKESLSKDQFKLYKLIWDRFIASQMESALFDTISVDISVSKYTFRATGSNVKFPGFMAIYSEGKDEEQESTDTNIPSLEEHEELKTKRIEPKQHFTQPPARYTEATLVKALEEKGIGRPSTYSPTISTILARGYVQKEQKFLFPTELGKIVNDIMKNHFKDIVDVMFTAQMEEKLDSVEAGNKKWLQIISDFFGPFDIACKEAENQIGNIEIPVEVTDIPCEKCGRLMVIKIGRYGKFLACPGFPECRNAKPIIEEAGVNCPQCGGKVLNKKSKKGKRYLGCENNPKCNFMTWDKPANENCPLCGNFLVKKSSNKGKRVQLKCIKATCAYTKNVEEE